MERRLHSFVELNPGASAEAVQAYETELLNLQYPFATSAPWYEQFGQVVWTSDLGSPDSDAPALWRPRRPGAAIR